MKPRSSPLSRRTVLRGSGVAIALPLLEAMLPGQKKVLAQTRAKRFVTFFSPNGTIPGAWRPSGTGTSFELPRILVPLARHKARIQVVSGVGQRIKPEVVNDHAQGMICGLSGLRLLKGTIGCAGGPCGFQTNGMSVDQQIGDHIGGGAKFKSIELGAGPDGSGGIYGTASIRGATRLFADYNPASAFARLFNGSVASPPSTGGAPAAPVDDRAIRRSWAERKSVLDAVKADFDGLRMKMGAEDRLKLDGHVESLREVEKRIVGLEPGAAVAPGMSVAMPSASCSKPNAPSSDRNLPLAGKIQMDLLTMALACDLTRVASMYWGCGACSTTYDFLNVKGAHHPLSHESSAEAIESLTKINTWYAEQYAYLLDRMIALKDPTGASLLDGAIVMSWTEIGEGRSHGRGNMPYVFAGSGGGFGQGRHVALSGASHTDMFATIAQAFGINNAVFGEPAMGKGPLRELLA